MNVSASRANLTEVTEDVLIVPVFDDESPAYGLLAELNERSGGLIAASFESGEFDGKRDRWTLFHNLRGLRAPRLMLFGAGDAADLSSQSLQRIAGAAVRVLAERGARTVAFALTDRLLNKQSGQAVVEGALLGVVTPGLYRASDKPGIKRLLLVSTKLDEGELTGAAERGAVMGEATNLARSLCFEPSNVLTPTELALRAETMATREGLKFEALGETEMKERGMGALLAVSRGSQEPARLIVLNYEPEGAPPDTDLIALVGKGITFDSGGISIKPAERMEEMKYDMGGGAAVIGAMQIMARLRPNARVLGLVPASENLPSGRAVKPGDVVRSMSGRTIEVANTDAEGRLVLCDAISYAIERGAKTIVDAATLTGAVAVALGEVRGAVMGNDQQVVSDLISAGDQCGERVWPMPMDKEYLEIIKSDIADVRNVGNRSAGSITAGWFLRQFAGDARWAHLDIAGTAWLESEKPYIAKGATGFGTRLMANFVLNRAPNAKA